MKFFGVVLAIFCLVSASLAIKNDVCSLKHSMDGDEQRQCRALIPMWSYNSNSKQCVSFYYGGCGGNDNRFNSKEECEKTCKE